MSLFRIPRIVRLRLEKIRRDFLWGGGNLDHKSHLVNWDTVCSSKVGGGLGVRRLDYLNKALLGKWNWRYVGERGALWHNVINRRYGEEEGGWRTCEVGGAYGVGMWKAIRMDWAIAGKGMAYVVGNGRRVKFWEDRWCGEEPLKVAFPTLFAIATSKEAWVAEVWDGSLEAGGWAPCFSSAFNDWELEEVERFLSRLQRKRLQDFEDIVVWVGAKDGRFAVKRLCGELKPMMVFPSMVIWNAWVPPKAWIFAWEATWNKILTLDNVQKRGWVVASRCNLCKKEEESTDHLLIHCNLTHDLWHFVFPLFGVLWVLPSTVKEVLLSWHGSFVGRSKKVWYAAPLCLF